MPLAALWSLIVGLVILALGLMYKVVEFSHALKLSDKETDSLRSRLVAVEETRNNESLGFRTEVDTLKKTHNKEISDIQELHQREAEELRHKIAELTSQAHKKPTSERKYLTTGAYKWEVTVFNDGEFDLNEYPICVNHDLKFIFGSQSKYCPSGDCRNRLSEYDEFKVHETVKSLIERNIRNGKWDEV